MSASTFDLAAREVLREYPFIGSRQNLTALGNRGGFSGARLWRVETATGTFCLKGWPSTDDTPEHFDLIHHLMGVARDAGLAFVPAIFPSSGGMTCVEHAGRLWDLTTWMPGRADFHDQPTPLRLAKACAALARLHGAWSLFLPLQRVDRCPAIQRRLEGVLEWLALTNLGWQPSFLMIEAGRVRSLAERAWALLRTWTDWVPCALATWVERPLPLQPCLCDVWHAHVLFEGDTVTGVIDYGGVKIDHVAVDLARLLGSLVGENAELRAAGLQAYTRLRPLSWEEEALITVLDETGTVVAMMTWLKWLLRDAKGFEDATAVARRLEELVKRVESWNRR